MKGLCWGNIGDENRDNDPVVSEIRQVLSSMKRKSPTLVLLSEM